ncbi:hypothetical protein CA850_01190 [Micromonospora echinospora]|nr:hypothetical protein CA850_01190 [Micromonospora echinospora]
MVLALGMILTAYALIDEFRAGSAYQVNFVRSGDECTSRADININAKTGGRMICFGTVPEGESPFTRAERDHVVALAEHLGANADGFTDADRRQVEDLVRSIGAANGDPDETADRGWFPGRVAYLLGVPMLFAGGLAVLLGWANDPAR